MLCNGFISYHYFITTITHAIKKLIENFEKNASRFTISQNRSNTQMYRVNVFISFKKNHDTRQSMLPLNFESLDDVRVY